MKISSNNNNNNNKRKKKGRVTCRFGVFLVLFFSCLFFCLVVSFSLKINLTRGLKQFQKLTKYIQVWKVILLIKQHFFIMCFSPDRLRKHRHIRTNHSYHQYRSLFSNIGIWNQLNCSMPNKQSNRKAVTAIDNTGNIQKDLSSLQLLQFLSGSA